MIKLLSYYLPLLFLCICSSCKTTEKRVITDEPVKTVSASINDISSAQAKIIGKIISINEARDETGPCSKVPCEARIIIQNLENKGSLFQLNSMQDTIPVAFAFTLVPTTEELFPGMKTSYPGLKINDRFEAKIESRLAKNEQGVSYIIYEYKKFTYEK